VRRQQAIARTQRFELAYEFLVRPDSLGHHLQLQHGGHVSRLMGSGARRQIVCVIDGPHATHTGEGCLENLQAFRSQLRDQARYPGDVPAGTWDRGHQVGGDRIADLDEDNGNRLSGVLDGTSGLLRLGEDQIDATLDEGRGGRRRLVELSPGEANVERDVTTLFEAQSLEAGLEARHRWDFLEETGVEHADPVGTAGPLRVGGGR